MVMEIVIDDETKTDRGLLAEFFEHTRELLRKLVFGELSPAPEDYFVSPTATEKLRGLHYSHGAIEISRLSVAVHDLAQGALEKAGLIGAALRAKIQVAVDWAKGVMHAADRTEIVQAVMPVLKQCQSLFASAATAAGLGEAAKEYLDVVMNALSDQPQQA